MRNAVDSSNENALRIIGWTFVRQAEWSDSLNVVSDFLQHAPLVESPISFSHTIDISLGPRVLLGAWVPNTEKHAIPIASPSAASHQTVILSMSIDKIDHSINFPCFCGHYRSTDGCIRNHERTHFTDSGFPQYIVVRKPENNCSRSSFWVASLFDIINSTSPLVLACSSLNPEQGSSDISLQRSRVSASSAGWSEAYTTT